MSAQDRISLMLTATDASVRRRTAEELIGLNLSDREVIVAFAKGLTDADKGVRDICALALERANNVPIPIRAEAVAPLITKEDIEVRNLAGDVLLKFGAAAVDALYPYLSDPKEDNRKFACDIIGLSNI